MKIKVKLSIGYCNADQDDILEIDDSELEGLTDAQRESYLMEQTKEWANNYIEYWYEVVE